LIHKFTVMTEINEKWLREHKFIKHKENMYRLEVPVKLPFSQVCIEVCNTGKEWEGYYSLNGNCASSIKKTQEGIATLYRALVYDKPKP
jgi:hypothetical protein